MLFDEPRHVKALYRRARALLTLGRHAECEADVEAALEAEPGLAEAPPLRKLRQRLEKQRQLEELSRRMAAARGQPEGYAFGRGESSDEESESEDGSDESSESGDEDESGDESGEEEAEAEEEEEEEPEPEEEDDDDDDDGNRELDSDEQEEFFREAAFREAAMRMINTASSDDEGDEGDTFSLS